MIAQNLLNSLKIIHTRLIDPTEKALNWVVTGSLGMVLNGMEMDIHDIDLQTDQEGAFEIEHRLLGYRKSPVYFKVSERIRSYFGVFEIEGIQVEVMGDMQHLLLDQTWLEPVNLDQNRKWIEIERILVPVMSLEHEYEAYQLMGRIEKAERVRQFLMQSKSKS